MYRGLYSLALLLSLSLTSRGQTVLPLALNGILESMSPPNNASDPRSGGTITVNGFSITIPDNLLFAFPASFVPYAQVAAAFPGFGGDTGHQVDVVANIVNGQPVAGQVTIADPLGEAGQGQIEGLSIDGAIKILNGPTIRINDPNAVYSSGYKLKPFFTADDKNPSISAFSGFPMCVSRSSNDPLCPASNRPTGQTAFNAPDPLVMAPFVVGDFIDYAGIKVGGEIICYSIVANVMIFSTTPGYIRVEDALIGIIDPDPNVEFSTSKFIGYTSDAAATISVFAIDVDPCDGTETDRLIVSGVPVSAAAAPVNRNKLPIGQYTREYHIVLSSGTTLTKNNITAGQYHQPVTEWVFPELNAIGAAPPSNDFSNIAPLANGFGPNEQGWIFKQLTPWPGRFPAPTQTKVCPDRVAAPTTSSSPTSTSAVVIVVSAQPNLLQKPGTLAQLSAKNTAPDILNSDLTFTWSQINGTAAPLTNNNTATPSFVIPLQTEGIKVRWYLVNMTHVSGSFAVDSVSVTADNTIKDVVTIDSYTRSNNQGGTITVTAHSNLIGDPAATMRIQVAGGPITPMTAVGTGQGRWTYTQRSVAATAGILLTSSGGGTASRTAPG